MLPTLIRKPRDGTIGLLCVFPRAVVYRTPRDRRLKLLTYKVLGPLLLYQEMLFVWGSQGLAIEGHIAYPHTRAKPGQSAGCFLERCAE